MLKKLNTYKDGEKVNVKNKLYKYDSFYKYLRNENAFPLVICPVCLNTKFEISYGDYECIAHCECGHKFTIYDG